jgi:xylulokinase
MYLLGYDIGSSSVKASLVDADNGKCVASTFYPKEEAEIIAVRPGWAEQKPSEWWKNLKLATADVLRSSRVKPADIGAIGISYQMHGLVCVDKNHQVLRPAIIWCDSRAVPYGNRGIQRDRRGEVPLASSELARQLYRIEALLGQGERT